VRRSGGVLALCLAAASKLQRIISMINGGWRRDENKRGIENGGVAAAAAKA
jgi:hypothetical protein